MVLYIIEKEMHWTQFILYLTRSKKKKAKEDLGMACHTPPLKRENAITQPRFHPIKILGWDGTMAG